MQMHSGFQTLDVLVGLSRVVVSQFDLYIGILNICSSILSGVLGYRAKLLKWHRILMLPSFLGSLLWASLSSIALASCQDKGSNGRARAVKGCPDMCGRPRPLLASYYNL
eukprot:c42360_g1_i1 orf=35-364(-)